MKQLNISHIQRKKDHAKRCPLIRLILRLGRGLGKRRIIAAPGVSAAGTLPRSGLRLAAGPGRAVTPAAAAARRRREWRVRWAGAYMTERTAVARLSAAPRQPSPTYLTRRRCHRPAAD